MNGISLTKVVSMKLDIAMKLCAPKNEGLINYVLHIIKWVCFDRLLKNEVCIVSQSSSVI